MDKEKLRYTLIIFASVIAIGISELLLKYGLVKIGTFNFANDMLGTFFTIFSSAYVISAIALMGISSLLWLIALSRAELSYAYPLLGMGYAVVAFFSWVLFNDILTPVRITGIFVIMLGVFMMSRS